MSKTLPPIDALGLACAAVADLSLKQNVHKFDVMWTAGIVPNSEHDELRSPFWQAFGTAAVLTHGMVTV